MAGRASPTLGLLSGLLLMGVGCGDKSTDSGLDLNTRSRTHTGTILEIQRWDPVNTAWVETPDKLPMVIEWRFVSLKELADGGYSVSGVYTIIYLNISSEPVDVAISSLVFLNNSRSVLADFRPDPALVFDIAADSQETLTGFFELTLDDIALTGEITRLEVRGVARYKV